VANGSKSSLSNDAKGSKAQSQNTQLKTYRLIHVLVRMRQFWLAGMHLQKLLVQQPPSERITFPPTRRIHSRTIMAVLEGLFSSVRRRGSGGVFASDAFDPLFANTKDENLPFGLKLYSLAQHHCDLIHIHPRSRIKVSSEDIPGHTMHRAMFQAFLRQYAYTDAAKALKSLLVSFSELVALEVAPAMSTPHEAQKTAMHARLASEHLIRLVAAGIQKEFGSTSPSRPRDRRAALEALVVLAPMLMSPPLETDMTPIWRLFLQAYRSVRFQDTMKVPQALRLDLTAPDEAEPEVRVTSFVFSVIKGAVTLMKDPTVTHTSPRRFLTPILHGTALTNSQTALSEKGSAVASVHPHSMTSLLFLLSNVRELFEEGTDWCFAIAVHLATRINTMIQAMEKDERGIQFRNSEFWLLFIAPYSTPRSDELKRLSLREHWRPKDVLQIPFFRKMSRDREDRDWMQNVEPSSPTGLAGNHRSSPQDPNHHWIAGEKWGPREISRRIDPISIADAWAKLRWGEEDAAVSRLYRGPAPILVPVSVTHVPVIDKDGDYDTILSQTPRNDADEDQLYPPQHQLHAWGDLWSELTPRQKAFEDRYGRLLKPTEKAVRQELFESWDISQMFLSQYASLPSSSDLSHKPTEPDEDTDFELEIEAEEEADNVIA